MIRPQPLPNNIIGQRYPDPEEQIKITKYLNKLYSKKPKILGLIIVIFFSIITALGTFYQYGIIKSTVLLLCILGISWGFGLLVAYGNKINKIKNNYKEYKNEQFYIVDCICVDVKFETDINLVNDGTSTSYYVKVATESGTVFDKWLVVDFVTYDMIGQYMRLIFFTDNNGFIITQPEYNKL